VEKMRKSKSTVELGIVKNVLFSRKRRWAATDLAVNIQVKRMG
jgi:hypothetical protein